MRASSCQMFTLDQRDFGASFHGSYRGLGGLPKTPKNWTWCYRRRDRLYFVPESDNVKKHHSGPLDPAGRNTELRDGAAALLDAHFLFPLS